MELAERLTFFLIGTGLGFVCGYVVARLRVIETKLDDVGSEVHEVDTIVKRKRDERGSFKLPGLTHILMILALTVTAGAAFMTAKVNSDLQTTVECLTQFNAQQNKTLSSRDQAVKDETQAEIYLWTVYGELYEIGVDGTPKEQALIQERFSQRILQYRDQLVETQRARSLYEYQDPDILKDCKE